MKYIFLINNYTVSNNKNKLIEKINLFCNEKKLDYIIEINDTKETEEILNKYNDSENIIIAIGGDGIINRVLNSIINTNNILGFIPSGTGNDLYKSVKNSLKKEIEECDVIKINNKYFINVTCFGIDADIGNKKNIVDSKIIPKKLRYDTAILTTFFKYHNREMKLTINDEIIENKFATIAVCNGSYYGGGYKIGYKSKINDGLLDVYVVEDVSRIEMIKLLLKMKKEKLNNTKNLKVFSSNKLLIESPNIIDCNMDGEILSCDRFEIELLPNKMKIYYNQEMIDKILK